MGYRVVSRFFDRARQVYVDPGASCPHLDPAEAKRLVGANCLVEVADDAPPANPLRRRRDAPPAPEAPAPTGAGE
jgi:hypothetical protein